MTKRDFFILIIKLFGLYSLVTALFQVLPLNLSFLAHDHSLLMVSSVAVTMLLVIGLFTLLILKSDKVVSFLKLERGFDGDKFHLGSLTASEIVKISCVVIGGFLIIDNLPLFINQVVILFKTDLQTMNFQPNSKFTLFIYGLNLLLGYLLLTQLNTIVRLLRIDNKKDDIEK